MFAGLKCSTGIWQTLKSLRISMYQVIVGNIGTVYEGDDEFEAYATFQMYRIDSKYSRGRAAGESVTLLADGEVVKEYVGEQE